MAGDEELLRFAHRDALLTGGDFFRRPHSRCLAILAMVQFGKRAKTLPIVLGRQEVGQLLRCTHNLKQRTFITTLYATGVRFSEVANLQIRDIDSARMQIHITHGKGAKQRQVPLSPRLLSELHLKKWEEMPIT